MPLALEIAARIHRLHYDDLTPTALEWTRAAFIDTIGVTLAGIVEDGPRILMKVPGIASGGVGTLAHLSALAPVAGTAIVGAIVGRALHEARFSLDEAVQAAKTQAPA